MEEIKKKNKKILFLEKIYRFINKSGNRVAGHQTSRGS